MANYKSERDKILHMFDAQNYHVLYQDVTNQHWDPESESYAGGDNLMTALERGWVIEECTLERCWYAGMRSVQIYQFTLSRDEKTITMSVIENPYIYRFAQQKRFEIEGLQDVPYSTK